MLSACGTAATAETETGSSESSEGSLEPPTDAAHLQFVGKSRAPGFSGLVAISVSEPLDPEMLIAAEPGDGFGFVRWQKEHSRQSNLMERF